MRKKFLLKRILALPLLTLFLAALALAQVPAVGGEAAASGDTAWEEELLRERVLKDIEFKTSVTSPMAGRERLIVPAAARTFILVSGGEVKTSELHAKGAAFALLFRDGQWYWDEGAPGVTCSEGGGRCHGPPATEQGGVVGGLSFQCRPLYACRLSRT